MAVSRFVSRAGWLLMLGVAVPAFASNTNKDAKEEIRVQQFEVGSGVQVPDEYRSALQQHLLETLKEDKNFSSVVTDAPSASTASEHAMRLSGTITEFEARSKKKRILTGGFGRMAGAGATRLKSHVKLVDASSGSVIWEGDVAAAEKGSSMWNPASPYTSSSLNVTRTEAKDIAKELDRAVKHSDK